MGKYENNRSNSYNANRSSGCSYNANRSRNNESVSRSSKACCESDYRNRASDLCCENEYNNRASDVRCESEYNNRASDLCCESDYRDRASDPCCKNEYANCSSDDCWESGYADRAFSGGKGNSYCASADSYVWRGGGHADSCDDDCCRESCPAVLHLHEVQGSVQVASDGCKAHNHRFATVTSEPILLKNGRHVHKLTLRTDACEGHCHEFCGMTTENYEICSGHVHYCEGKTGEQAGHCHEFRFITHIENPMEQ